MAEDFAVVFDLAAGPDRWLWTRVVPLLLVVVGFGLAVMPRSILDQLFHGRLGGLVGRAFGVVFFVFAASVAGIDAHFHFSRLARLTDLERTHRLTFLAGCLQGFHPMPEGGHEDELVKVGGKEFSYSDFDESSPAFNNSESHGGPIHADSAVRVWYAGNDIVRLEVRDHACPRAPDLPQQPR
jgi:hypothetical protein